MTRKIEIEIAWSYEHQIAVPLIRFIDVNHENVSVAKDKAQAKEVLSQWIDELFKSTQDDKSQEEIK